MVQFYGISWIFLVSTLSHSSRLDAEIKKYRKIRIAWSLSEAICVQRGTYERNKKTQPPLNELAAYESQGKQLCSHISRTHCEYSKCKRFQCSNNGPGNSPNIIVRMKSQLKCGALPIPCINETGCYVTPNPNTNKRAFQAQSISDSLKAHATKSQASVLNILKSSNFRSALSIEQLWITNEIIVKEASLSDVQNILKSSSDVEEVRAERLFKIPEASSKFLGKDKDRLENLNSGNQKTKASGNLDNWHIGTMEADKVWAEGITGKGIIVGHIDTGVHGGHESLKNNFRGDYGWFDPYFRKPEPYDDMGHGTHTLGTAVGQAKNLGVAPGATWMSCKGCRGDGNCTESATKTCAQWILCPTKWDGTDADCSMAPHVVNNSWGDEPLQDDSDAPYQAEFEQLIHCWRSAGIIPVFSVGNLGFICGRANYPAVSDHVIAVGNVGRVYTVNYINFTLGAYTGSSRGPPRSRYKQLVKPDLSAPGEDVISGTIDGNRTDEYYALTGTSMSTPQVTGTIALMLEKNPSLQFDGIWEALTQSCSPVEIPRDAGQCGNISLAVYPNHHMGYGIINSFKAVFGAGTSGEEC